MYSLASDVRCQQRLFALVDSAFASGEVGLLGRAHLVARGRKHLQEPYRGSLVWLRVPSGAEGSGFIGLAIFFQNYRDSPGLVWTAWTTAQEHDLA